MTLVQVKASWTSSDQSANVPDNRDDANRSCNVSCQADAAVVIQQCPCRGQWMLSNLSCARHRSDELLGRLLLRKLALLRHQWPCRELVGIGLAPTKASVRLHPASLVCAGYAGRERYSTIVRSPSLSFFLEPPCWKGSSAHTLDFRSTFPLSSSKGNSLYTTCLSVRQTRHLQSVARSFISRWKKSWTSPVLVKPNEKNQGIGRAEHGLLQDGIPSPPQHTIPTELTERTYGSNRQRKRKRVPVSKVLYDALKSSNGQVTRPTRWSRKQDYSYQSPLSSKVDQYALFKRNVLSDHPHELSLQSVLASYTLIASRQSNHDGPNEALARIFNSQVREYLASKGYGETDVVLWHWILSAVSSERAALRLNLAWVITEQRPASEKVPIPVFVFLQLLRRTDLGLRALYHLITHAWQRLGNVTPTVLFLASRERLNSAWAPHHRQARGSLGPEPFSLSTTSSGNSYNMTELSIMLMTVRLLRHARRLWPASLPSIATLFTRYINGQIYQLSSVEHLKASRLSKRYNKTLSLISYPCSANPFNQVSHQQTAQFIVLKAMDTHRPSLVVTREGYRAVTRVQLAHHKTYSEQSWADLKSTSWPPWKEDKLGFDAEKGMESGLSRASHALRKMYESGYPMHVWEQTAEIYAGWDTDASPTIQTRKFIPVEAASSLVTLHATPSARAGQDEPTHGSIWAGRIRATRTLDEAWACFLHYYKTNRKRDQEVYLAMFEKLFFDAKRRKEERLGLAKSPGPSVYPGDGLEVFPRPSYANAGIYVPTPPPTTDVFLSLLQDHGVRPTRRLLAFLFHHAHSFRFGRKVYEISYQASPLIISFLYRRNEALIPEIAEVVKEWPDYLLASFLFFVGKFMPPRRARKIHGQTISIADDVSTQGDIGLAIIIRVKPRYLPAWYNVISSLASRSAFDHHGVDDFYLINPLLILKITHAMQGIELEPDMQGVQLMCNALEASLWAQRSLSAQPQRQADDGGLCAESPVVEPHAVQLRNEAVIASRDLLAYIKGTFERRVSIGGIGTIFQEESSKSFLNISKSFGAVDPVTQLPQVLNMPPAASLHALIRVLGLSHDYKGLLQLTRWIAQHGPELHLACAEQGQDYRMLRRMLVAVRAFLFKACEDEVVQVESCGLSHDEQYGHESRLTNSGPHEAFFTTNTSATEDQLKERGAVSGLKRGSEKPTQQAIDAINSIDFEWGGWPTDDELEYYLQRGRPF